MKIARHVGGVNVQVHKQLKGPGMSTKRLRFAAVAVLFVLASLAVAACGSDNNNSSSTSA